MRGLLFILLCVWVSPIFGEQESSEICLPTKNLIEIAQHFRQFESLIDHSNEQTCSTKNTEQWMIVGKALNVLYENSVTFPEENSTDPLTFRAVKSPDLWGYLTKRANRFDLTPSQCWSASAWVWDRYPGEINICPPYYTEKMNSAEIAQILLHEVRHFDDYDGFSHRRCPKDRGFTPGTYACDPSIEHKGSYAVSVQALAIFGLKGGGLSAGERQLSRASAIVRATYHFIRIPKIKMENFLFLQSEESEIFHWDKDQDRLWLIGRLGSNERVFMDSSSRDIIIYPEDPNIDGRRYFFDFRTEKEERGQFMTIYNGLEPADRQDFKDVEYGPSRSGGILIGNQFVCSCGDEFTVLQDDRLNDFESLFHIGDDVHLKDRSGALFNTVCSKDGKSLKILDSELKVEPSVVELIEFNGQKWALSHDGRVYHTDQQSGLIRIGSVVESKSLQSKIWKRVQSLTVPALFLSDDRSNYLEAE